MQITADLHLHSKYSRAVSQDMILPTMSRVAAQKGIDLLTTSDWTHPLWLKEIKGQLEEAGEGIYKLKPEIRSTKSETKSNDQNTKSKTFPKFLLSTEISSIYTQGGKLRRIHNLVFVPSIETAEKVVKELMHRGCNLLADGRPIVGISSHDLLELLLTIDERILLIPCHVWTPHFGLYGSASGFDSIEESFTDLSEHIVAIETGLSSDPEMNWQITELKKRSIVSFSDAHSPAKMGREATVFELEEVSYENIRRALMKRDKGTKGDTGDKGKNVKAPFGSSGSFVSSETSRIVYTIEFYPEEGKYHYSGHRNCHVYVGPTEIREKGNSCPVCKRKLTEGVLFRLQQLADPSLSESVLVKPNSQGLKWYTDATKTHPPYVKLVPLLEIIAESMSSTVFSQKVKNFYQQLVTTCDSELTILLKTPPEAIARVAGEKVSEAVMKVRRGDIVIRPGYDGEYGKVAIWQEGEETRHEEAPGGPQLSLDL